MGGKLDLETQFAFYGAYHTQKINVLIHVVCVPLIFFTSLVLTHSFPGGDVSFGEIKLPSIQGDYSNLRLTYPFLVAVGYATYFVVLEPLAGALYAPFLLLMGHWSNSWYTTSPNAVKHAGLSFVLAWIAQFIGHGKFEGRAPAIFESLFQSIVLAPFFVWLEVLFYFGYRPTLHRRLQNRIGKSVAEYRKEKAAFSRGEAWRG